ncbi:Dolichyl-diphosphooligosaccharide--protein glycosyltransferase subunit 2 [Aphelenchoides besseyi]|nr:Dolichyl-diphosphooligosaccharide--protein glycosyltransferase subunit 2 [Aphelenchoides besseyi]KAI6208488.1 Dolichyl-diphosphooligosaccharide--protein glycosyltransferase subunit 2 [Aphelenchoides besseyi]
MKVWLASAVLVACFIVTTDAGATQSRPKAGTKISVKDASVAVSGYGEDSLGAHKPVSFGQKFSSVIELEGKQQLQIKFTVVDEKSQPLIVHQAFVIFVHEKTKQEVAYVAEPDAQSKVYTFDLNLKNHAKEFAGLSGSYEIRLILGDSAASNAINWHLADAKLKVAAVVKRELPKSQQVSYEPKPEIKHLFREPEKRPPGFIADIFAIICAVPLLFLIVAWLRIGINFGNLPNVLWVLGFHASLTAVFGLYFVFWLRLNMFVTLKYLGIIVVSLFFFGHRLFRSLAAKRKLQ